MGFIARALLLAAGSYCVAAQPKLRNERFAQLDWKYDSGALAQANSSFGQMSWTYDPINVTYYLNVKVALTKDNDEASFVIQSLPLSGVDNGDYSPRNESAYFNIADLGLLAGKSLDELFYGVTIDLEPLAPAPDELRSNSSYVQKLDICACSGLGDLNNSGIEIGEPLNVKILTTPVKLTKGRSISGVQEGVNKCVAGGFARSLAWLNDEYNLGMDRSAQEIYEDLITEGVSSVDKSRNLYGNLAAWIVAKDIYARKKTNNKIVTKYWAFGEFPGVGDIPGFGDIPVDLGDFSEWFEREVKTEDIELGFLYGSGGGHMITVVEASKAGDGSYVIKYRDDIDDNGQGHSDRGDRTLKRGTIVKEDKAYYFNGKIWRIIVCIAESYIPPPIITGVSDPHMTNSRGAKFDIASTGRMPFILAPGGAASEHAGRSLQLLATRGHASVHAPSALRHRFLSH